MVAIAEGRGVNVSIAKFAALTLSTVIEQIETTWDVWLDHLVSEPKIAFTTQMEHGGWSPVTYNPPRRAKDNVKQVSALVLDYDENGNWEQLHKLWAQSYGAIYTTKSHGASGTVGDRLRVVLPLARNVTADEYAKIWEWAAARSLEAGCPADGQCKDASRFWYDPTKPPGGWRAVKLTGDPVDPEAILALAPATQPRLSVVRTQRPIDSDERVRRARAYLAKIPGAVSGDAGHTTTFNAVAHVMIGFDLDSATTLSIIANDYNPRCSPEWTDKQLEHKVASVAKHCKRERGYLLKDRPVVTSTRSAAAQAPEAPAELDVDWTSLLLVKKDFTPRRAYHNTAVFVRHHPQYRGKWSLDMMTGSPWFDGALMPDSFVHDIRAHADQRLGFTPGRDDVEAAIVAAAQDRPFHPILQYLRSVDWDGEPRLASIARDFLHSNDPVHAEMVRKFMIGAAARAVEPGCKHDTALMLVGPQGIRKSTFFSVLGGPWHADSFIDITNKDGLMQLHSAWIYELSELENVVSGARESRLKAWITSSHDMYRAPYQRTVNKRPRAVVICGTTNRTQFLTDDSGSRRFWIVPVHKEIPVALLSETRDQLWAEALCAYEAGERWWLDQEAEAQREEANAEYAEVDSWMEQISEFLERPNLLETSVSEVLVFALKVDPAFHDLKSQMRVGRLLKACGWTRRRDGWGGRSWKYIRAEEKS